MLPFDVTTRSRVDEALRSPEALSVFMDELLEAGDPWGALIQEQRQGGLGLSHLDALFGSLPLDVLHARFDTEWQPWVSRQRRPQLDVIWRDGFVETFELRDGPGQAALQSFFAAPALRAVRGVSTPSPEVPGLLDALSTWPRLETLELGLVPVSRLPDLSALPGLRHLSLQWGRPRSSPSRAPRLSALPLRSLALRLGGLHPGFVDSLAEHAPPGLEHLALHLADAFAPSAETALRALVEGALLPRLRGISLSGEVSGALQQELLVQARRRRFEWVAVSVRDRTAGDGPPPPPATWLGALRLRGLIASLRAAQQSEAAQAYLRLQLRREPDSIPLLSDLGMELPPGDESEAVYEALHQHAPLALVEYRNHALTVWNGEEERRASVPLDVTRATRALAIIRRGLERAAEAPAPDRTRQSYLTGLADLHHLEAEALRALGASGSAAERASLELRRALETRGEAIADDRYYAAVSLARLGLEPEAADQLALALERDPAWRDEARLETAFASLAAVRRVLE